MTSKDVARQVVQKLNHCNDESFEHPKTKPGLEWQVEVIEQALQAHGEAEYARGLEDAADIPLRLTMGREDDYWRDLSDFASEVEFEIRALKPKEDGK